MMFKKSSLLLLILGMAFAVLPLSAEETKVDGLTLLGTGTVFTDLQSNSTLVMRGFHTKYKEPIVGMYVKQNNKSVSFYMNAVNWDQLKQNLIKTRDQWETLSPTQFEWTGQVRGYRIGNERSTLRVSMQGKTTLDSKRLDFSLTGGANTPTRVFISLTRNQVKMLVDEFYVVDALLRQ